MLASRETVEYCIMFFVAFHLLTSIDNIYAKSLNDVNYLEAIERPLVFKRKPSKINLIERSNHHKLIRGTTMTLTFLYDSVYYYFTPFIINFIPYLFPKITVD